MQNEKGVVVYIGGEFPDKDASALRIMANAKALRDYGYSVVIISEDREMKTGVHKENVQGFEIYYTPYPSSQKQWLQTLISIKIYRQILANIPHVKAIICYNHRSVSLLRLCFYAHRRHIPVLADCTEWHTTNHLPFIKRIIKTTDTSFRINYVQKKTDGVIAISSFFSKMYCDKISTIFVPPLIDKAEDKWLVTAKQDPTEARRFVYAGRMGIGKDLVNRAIEAFSLLHSQNYCFEIFGCSEQEYRNSHPEEDDVLQKMQGKIHFHGYVSHTTVLQYTKKADFTLLIREHNRKNDSGFPTKFGESVTCGTPVIATDFSDVKEFVEKYHLGIMLDSVDSLQMALTKAIEMSDEELKTYKESCRVCPAFDYHEYISDLGEFVDKAIEGI